MNCYRNYSICIDSHVITNLDSCIDDLDIQTDIYSNDKIEINSMNDDLSYIPKIRFVVDRHKQLSLVDYDSDSNMYIVIANELAESILLFIKQLESQLSLTIKQLCLLGKYFGFSPDQSALAMLKSLTAQHNQDFEKYKYLLPKFDISKRMNFFEW